MVEMLGQEQSDCKQCLLKLECLMICYFESTAVIDEGQGSKGRI